jgi:hypothetical protein
VTLSPASNPTFFKKNRTLFDVVELGAALLGEEKSLEPEKKK